jgi:hypothetical protein
VFLVEENRKYFLQNFTIPGRRKQKTFLERLFRQELKAASITKFGPSTDNKMI